MIAIKPCPVEPRFISFCISPSHLIRVNIDFHSALKYLLITGMVQGACVYDKSLGGV